MIKKTDTPQPAHTELRRTDGAATPDAKAPDPKSKPVDVLPDPDPEDTLDDLFNDLPV